MPTPTEPMPVPSKEAGAAVVSAQSGTELSPNTPASEPKPSGSFIKNALTELAKVSDPKATEAPKVEEPPKAAEPAKATEPPKTEEPAKAETVDEEAAKAEADIKRETATMSQAHKAAFTKLRYEARDLKRQLKAAQAAKTEAAVTGTEQEKTEANAEVERIKAEYEAMKGKVENYEKELYSVKLESTELFQREVAQPRQTVADEIGAISSRYEGIDDSAIIAAVRSADPEKVSAVTADMSEFDRYRFYNLVDQYQKLNAKEQSLRADSKNNLENYSKQLREAEEAKRSEEKSQWEKSIGEVWDSLLDQFPVLAPVDGDDEWNDSVEKVKTFASPDRYEKLTVRERAEALHRAAAFPVVVSELESVMEELKAAQEKLAKYEGATPGVSASGGAPEPGAAVGTATGEGAFVANALAALKKVGAR